MSSQTAQLRGVAVASARPLGDLRVLELSDGTYYAGRLLAMQGAEVTLVEPPEGFASRNAPPFLHDIQGPERSLSFQYFNAGKRSVVVDRKTAEGRARLRLLIAEVDIVLDYRLQAEWEAEGLGFATLQRDHPGLIWCSITGFGQQGPRATWKSDDFIAMAAGGMMQLAGYEDTGPFAGPGEIAVKSAGAFAAVACLVAVHARDKGAPGQFIDVSMQEVVALGTETAPQFFDIKGTIRKRLSRPYRQAGIGYYPCADGYVMVYAAEAGVGTGWTRLADWLVEAETPGAQALQAEEWLSNSYKAKPESIETFAVVFGRFAQSRTKQEIFLEGQRRRIAITPVNNGANVVDDPHVRAVNSIETVSYCEGEPVLGPTAPVIMSGTPCQFSGPAPLLSKAPHDHNLSEKVTA